jgi:hypothetical protein
MMAIAQCVPGSPNLGSFALSFNGPALASSAESIFPPLLSCRPFCGDIIRADLGSTPTKLMRPLQALLQSRSRPFGSRQFLEPFANVSLLEFVRWSLCLKRSERTVSHLA